MEKKVLPKIKLYTGNNSLSTRWFVYYSDENGKRKKIYGNINQFTSVPNRLKAASKLIEEITEDYIKESNSNYASKIYQELDNRREGWRPKTYACKKSKLKIFINWIEDKKWTEENVYNFFFLYLSKEKKLSNTTYNDYILCINQALGWVQMQHIIEPIEKRKASPSPAGYFTKSHKDFLIKAMKDRNPDLWFFVQFVYYCFLRPRSELRILKVGDVILEDKKILVPASVSKNKKQQYIAIPDVFFPIVERKIQGRNPNEYIFPGKDEGKPTGMNTYGRQHRLLLKDLGFDTTRYKLYSWKHTGAVMAVKAGIHIKQLQIQLRHHSLDQVDEYLRQLGVNDLGDLQKLFPSI